MRHIQGNEGFTDELNLPDGGTAQGVRHDGDYWLLIDSHLRTRQRFVMEGLERVVAAVIDSPPSAWRIYNESTARRSYALREVWRNR